MRPWARGAKGPLRRIAVALTGLLLSFALLSGLGHANSRYFYCDAMGLLQADPCAAAVQRDGDPAGAQLRATQLDCCEVGTFPPLPQAATPASRQVSPPALVALIPAVPDLCQLLPSSRERPNRSSGRWRAPPRSAGELRARLGVFLT